MKKLIVFSACWHALRHVSFGICDEAAATAAPAAVTAPAAAAAAAPHLCPQRRHCLYDCFNHPGYPDDIAWPGTVLRGGLVRHQKHAVGADQVFVIFCVIALLW